MSKNFAVALLAGAHLTLAAEPPKDPFADATAKIAPTVDETFEIQKDPAGHQYFKPGSESYYTKYLAAMKEPSLFERGKDRPAFEMRFLWLRSFHDPIAIRVWQTGEDFSMRAVRITQNKDYSLGAITVDTTRQLTRDQSRVLSDLIKATPLTGQMTPTEELSGSAGLDGAQWILETCEDQAYRRLDFWCLKDYGPSRYGQLGLERDKIRDTAQLLKFALHLLQLSAIKVPEDEIY